MMESFVKENSIVRKIWGTGDTILFIFAGAAAEFALNKAVDWLYYTGKLPSDPLGRLFSTVQYARAIVFSGYNEALASIDKITTIHKSIENARQYNIPDWAYRDVLYMLISYSIFSFELLERKLDDAEKEEVLEVFYRVGTRMGLKNLPTNYKDWLEDYKKHLENDLEKTDFTLDLFKQYKKHLGNFRYRVLLESQKLVVPKKVKELLGFKGPNFLSLFVPVFKLSRKMKLDGIIKSIIFPVKYKDQIKALDVYPV